MKRTVFIATCAWLFCLGNVLADELTIGNVTIPQGGTADLVVGYNFTSSTDKVGFTFSIALPEGISFVKDEDGDPVYEKNATSIDKLNIVCAGDGNFAGQPANASATIKGTGGVLITLKLRADASLAVGSNLSAGVTKVTFQQRLEGSVTDINLDDFTFSVNIGEPADTRTILDETSTTAPTAAMGVDVRVMRTIKAGEWSTICLPFAMTAGQVTAAFGSDVQLGDFKGYDVVEEGSTIKAINVKFDAATAIEANHPYIIKVGTGVTEFTVDGVDIDPQEAEINLGTSRKPKAFVGNYVAGTAIANGCLFLNDNKFWYSVGSTKIKAFRAYFDFFDLLPDFENNYAEARVFILFDDSATTGVSEKVTVNSEKYATAPVYNLNGQRVSQPTRGLYIVDGKKIVVK